MNKELENRNNKSIIHLKEWRSFLIKYDFSSVELFYIDTLIATAKDIGKNGWLEYRGVPLDEQVSRIERSIVEAERKVSNLICNDRIKLPPKKNSIRFKLGKLTKEVLLKSWSNETKETI